MGNILRFAGYAALAGGLAVLTGSDMGALAAGGALPAPMRYTVAPGVATPIEIKTVADALCTITSDKTKKGFLTAVADGRGIARFFVTPAKASEQLAHFAVSCKAGSKTTDYTIDVRANAVATAQMPAPTRTAMAIPSDAHIRPALTAAQASSLSDAELTQRGYPLKPDGKKYPDLYKGWLKAVSTRTVVLPPQTVNNPYIRHDVFMPAPTKGKVRAGAATSSNWSGIDMRDVPGAFAKVEGDWIVPSVRAKGDFFSNTASSEWVGLDGVGTMELVQAGSEQEVQENFGIASTSYYLWSEFLPQQPAEQVISRISIAPGDEIYTEVFIANSATGKPTLPGAFGVFKVQSTPPVGLAYEATVTTAVGSTVVAGRDAVWIMERPSSCSVFGCSVMDLAYYGLSNISLGVAAAPSPIVAITPCCGAAAINITMLNSASGNILSTTTIKTVISTDFDWKNYN